MIKFLRLKHSDVLADTVDGFENLVIETISAI